MMILTIEILQFFLNEFEMVDSHLLYRSEVKDETEVQRKLKAYLNRYDSYEPLHEDLKTNDVKQSFLVKDGKRYLNIGYRVSAYEI